jgi:hypothetical protein
LGVTVDITSPKLAEEELRGPAAPGAADGTQDAVRQGIEGRHLMFNAAATGWLASPSKEVSAGTTPRSRSGQAPVRSWPMIGR